MKLIDIKNLTFEYFRRDDEGNLEEMIEALKDVSIDVNQGEFVAIVGRNGSGKSTLIKNLLRRIAEKGITVSTARVPFYTKDIFKYCFNVHFLIYNRKPTRRSETHIDYTLSMHKNNKIFLK